MIAANVLRPGRVIALMVLVALVVSLLNSNHAGQEKKPDLTKVKFYPVQTCQGCHNHDDVSMKKFGYTKEFVLLNEFDTWRTKDRHALSFAALTSPRGQQMSRNLGVDVTKHDMCLGCHAFASLAEKRKFAGFQMADGVSCDGCHGPAERWFADHSLPDWRKQTTSEKDLEGMYNVRDPEKRAELCMSCHIGSPTEGKVITHTMYAAGHPPLPSFELASFSNNLPPHWRLVKDVPHFAKDEKRVADAAFDHTRLVIAGSIVGLRRSLDLLVNRAGFDEKVSANKSKDSRWPPQWFTPQVAELSGDPKVRWPELAVANGAGDGDMRSYWPEIAMAQSDCYACHHDLKSESWRQIRGYQGGKPGRPQIQDWPFTLPALILEGEQRAAFEAARAGLRASFNKQPFGKPKEVADHAQAMLDALPKPQEVLQNVNNSTATDWLRKLSTFKDTFYPDFDSARQIAWAFQAIYNDEWNRENPNHDKADKIFAQLDKMLNLTPRGDARSKINEDRVALCTKHLSKQLNELCADASFLDSLNALNDAELAASLERISNYEPQRFRELMGELSKLLPPRAQ